MIFPREFFVNEIKRLFPAKKTKVNKTYAGVFSVHCFLRKNLNLNRNKQFEKFPIRANWESQSKGLASLNKP